MRLPQRKRLILGLGRSHVTLLLAVVPLGGDEAQLRVTEDVVVRAADPVLGRSDEKIPIVGSWFPPHWKIWTRLAEG